MERIRPREKTGMASPVLPKVLYAIFFINNPDNV
jgi:hypothetical protein